MPFLPPNTDTPVAQLTAVGRNLLARSIVPRGKLNSSDPDAALVTFKVVGFAVGDGGYEISNPLQITPIIDATANAQATVEVVDNRFDVNDALIINGLVFSVGLIVVASGVATGGTDAGGPNSKGTLTVPPGTLVPNAHVGQRLRLTSGTLGGADETILSNTDSEIEIDKTWLEAGSDGVIVPDFTTSYQIITNVPGANKWVPGTTFAATATSIADVINASSHPLVKNVVKASVLGTVVTIHALTAGATGNVNSLVEFDSGGLGFNNLVFVPGTGFLSGGVDPELESPRFPNGAIPANVAPFIDIEFPNLSAVSLVCRIGASEGGNYGLGEIGIYADILDSTNPAEIGSRILYAIAHFPIVAKHANSNFVTRILTQY